MRLLLASASPRRRELIERLGLKWRALPVDFHETEGGDAAAAALANACGKAGAALSLLKGDEIAVGCDTVVVKDGVLYGKPKDEADARRMLGALCGAWHEVLTGMCALDGAGAGVCRLVRTRVFLRVPSPEELDAYILTGEPFDKAGAYGIQGAAGAFAEGIEGDVENVIGMSTAALSDMLRAFRA